jgi:hypothetical protein
MSLLIAGPAFGLPSAPYVEKRVWRKECGENEGGENEGGENDVAKRPSPKGLLQQYFVDELILQQLSACCTVL